MSAITRKSKKFNTRGSGLLILCLSFFLPVMQMACNNASKPAEPNAAEAAVAPSGITKVADSSLKPANPPANFKHQVANVNGVNIHYVIGGEGEPLVLIHGFGQNWFMWNRLLPELSKHFTVIAPDLRGVGESSKPEGGYDKKNMAVDIHELVKKLGYPTINLAGHDIGLMVAYAYAAQFPAEVKKVALLDALLPGIEPVWTKVYTSAWWFGFFARPTSGDLVAGRERLFLTDFWTVVGHKNDAFTKEETDEFIRAYAQPGATKGAFHWFGNFPQDAKDNLELSKQKLKMPFLTLGAEFQSASFLGDHTRHVAVNVTDITIKGVGHWIVQEGTDQVQKALLDFFVAK
ncbi:alpha/beta fold hydrolase [Flavitalea flava]